MANNHMWHDRLNPTVHNKRREWEVWYWTWTSIRNKTDTHTVQRDSRTQGSTFTGSTFTTPRQTFGIEILLFTVSGVCWIVNTRDCVCEREKEGHRDSKTLPYYKSSKSTCSNPSWTSITQKPTHPPNLTPTFLCHESLKALWLITLSKVLEKQKLCLGRKSDLKGRGEKCREVRVWMNTFGIRRFQNCNINRKLIVVVSYENRMQHQSFSGHRLIYGWNSE